MGGNLTGFQGTIHWDHSKPDGQPRRLLNTERAKDFFNFVPKVPLLDGLALTIEWYKSERNFES